jgi:hypothetical protein
MGTPRLRVILPTEVEALWPEISSRLLAAEDFSQGEFLISDLLPMVQRQEAFIAAMDNKTELDLVIVFQIMTFPRKKVLHVLAMGGQGFDVIMKSCWPELEKLALFLGTSAIRAAVRPSMQRYARRVAPEAVPVYTVVERPKGA